MAVNLVSPGVNIREVDLTLGRIDQTGAQIGAIAGPFEKGPINTPVLINNEKELLEVFGKPQLNDDQNEYWYSASNFLSYGGKLRVVRVGNLTGPTGKLYNANSAVSGGSEELRIFNDEQYDTSFRDATSWYFSAKTPGSWANNLKVCVIDNFADQTISGLDTSGVQIGFAVTQYSAGSVVEGSEIKSYSGFLRALITGIGNSEIYVKVQDFYDQRFQDIEEDGEVLGVIDVSEVIPAKYSKVEFTTDSPFAFNATQGDEFYIVDNSGANLETVVTDTGNISVKDWYDNQSLGLSNSNLMWKSVAPKPGTSEYSLERSSNDDEIHIVLVDDSGSISGSSGVILEKFIGVSKSSDARISPSRGIYYKSILESTSTYIYAGTPEVGVASKLVPVPGSPLEFTLRTSAWGVPTSNKSFGVVGKKTYTLTGGTDYSGSSFLNGYQPTSAEVIDGYRIFTNPAEYNVNYLICGPSGGTIIQEAQTKANTLISIAEERKDCIAVISPYKDLVTGTSNSSLQTLNILTFFSPLTSSSYAVFDGGIKYTFDRFNNRFFYMNCNSDIAGILARTALNTQPWFSPAGSVRGNINNVVKLAYNPSKDQRDQLYTNRINPVISNLGSGFILFGDKTALSYQSAFDRINVRMLFLTIERSIEQAARAQLFEFNDAITRSNFINIVEPYLRDVRAKRGITEFLVVCDETNNTPDIIDSNQFKADIFVKPARSINFIGLTFVATRTGVSFSEVVGTV
jgi:hypothetical protein